MTLSERVESIWYGPDGGSGLLPAMLGVLSLAYQAGLRIREFLYRAGVKGVKRPPVPCVSVGNLVVGGAGKTPAVRWITGFYRCEGVTPGVITRGYGGECRGPEVVPAGGGAEVSKRFGDEPAMLALLQPDVPVVVAKDRWAAGVTAADACGVELLVADDAFQHRRLGRDLDIVVVDAGRMFGNGRLFPRGPLREPEAALGRADVVLLNRVSSAGDSLAEKRAFLQGLAPGADLVEGDIVSSGWRLIGEEARGAERPPPGEVYAFCGLANTEDFRRLLKLGGFALAGWRPFADHHRYSRLELEELAHGAERSGAAAAVTTAKDAVRVRKWEGNVPLYVLDVELRILAGGERLQERLSSVARRSSA